MTVAPQQTPSIPVAPRLGFDQTVPRALVHRHAVGEVLVTDSARVDEDRFVVAALLPRTHWYYTDRLDPADRAVDPMLLLEACRQACTVVAHRHLGVPMDTAFLVGRWTVELPATDVPGPPSGELLLHLGTAGARVRHGQLSALSLSLDLDLAGHPLGRTEIDARYLRPEDYRAMRELRRGGPPPMSDTRPAARSGRPLPPSEVGRTRPENVLLVDAATTAAGVTARLDVPTGHASLYDHPLDHVPAMALLEAARQLAHHLVGPAGNGRLTTLSADFTRFAELDEPVQVIGVPDDGRTRVEFRQSEQAICTVEVGLR
ncbi:ScbA/BarX family gamma-butyrolactone biosynthesis protein [Micromonospora sp. DPT]|uniref:ScbA/BarX family gamma-butyrolactone biosynthesis protein n=1 Tax=Micromonospora sp. DPT TaxID=3142975 RepID=UPI00320A05AC